MRPTFIQELSERVLTIPAQYIAEHNEYYCQRNAISDFLNAVFLANLNAKKYEQFIRDSEVAKRTGRMHRVLASLVN